MESPRYRSRRTLKRLPLLVALVSRALNGSSLANAQVPVRSLLKPDAALSRPFGRITGLYELRDGRVIVVDANDESILLVDFTRDMAVQLGRKGSGPGEYRFPMRLLSLGADSIGVEDGGNGRILIISGQGKFGGILSALGVRVGSQAPARSEAPTTSDAQGRLYALGFSPFTRPTSPDSAPIERWRVGSLARETVAYLPLLPAELQVTRPGEGTRAFVTAPQWTVGFDGRVALLHVNPYAVELIDSKGRVKGKPISYQRIRVSKEHKRQWREEQARPRPVTIATPNGVSSAGLRRGAVQEPVRWPTYLPPFLDNAARFAPDGFLWIQRTVPAGSPELFDIVDGRGIVVTRVTTSARTRLVGFGQWHIYFARLDTDNQEFLERYQAIQRGKS